MNAIKYIQFDCTELESELPRHGTEPLNVRELPDADHVGFGGVKRFEYVNPQGATRYVMEQYGMYAADGYLCNSWQFSDDFSNDEACQFLKDHRNA